ncbi:protease HtpX-like protein [Bifidobacterium adolescentis]|uniref:Protease HtpX homolog n=1 Tax=Bifidobacterium adolescentis TaxID=1680 RepID=A0A1X2ZNU9_BIFAD|nr:protease HtpX-like protein [Bifidobacterium adolescentis]
MNGKLQVHGHCNGLKTTLLFALMWGVIMLIWWATGASQSTLGYYILIGLGSTFVSYWFSDKLAIASMHARQVSEQEAPVLYKIVRELSAKAGKPMPRIYIAPTMSPNAFATGRNERHAAVCCTQGILQTLNEREIRGVLGHELMHVYNHDILTSAIASAMATVISYLGYSLMYFGGGRSRDDRDDSASGGLGLLGVLLSTILAPIAASLIQMAISRTREYDADEDGSKLTEDPEALASALSKISGGAAAMPMEKTAGTQSVAAMMIASPFSAEGFSRLFSTHPPIQDRIARLMQMGQEMRQQGVQSGYLAGGYATTGVAAIDIRQGGYDGPQFGSQYGSAYDSYGSGSAGSTGGYSRDYSQRPCAEEDRADARTASRAGGSCPDFQPFPVLMLLRTHTCCADDSQNRYMWQIRDCRESDFRYMWHFPSRRCPHTFDFVPSNSSCPRRTATYSANRFCGTGQSVTYSGNGVLD